MRDALPASAYLAMEARILSAVDYRLASIATVRAFLHRLMRRLGLTGPGSGDDGCGVDDCAGGVPADGTAAAAAAALVDIPTTPAAAADGAAGAAADGPAPATLYHLASYLGEASLLEAGLLDLAPSSVAAAALVHACALLGRPMAAPAVEAVTGYSLELLMRPMSWLISMHVVLSRAGPRYSVFGKYQHARKAWAAAVAPMASPLDARFAAYKAQWDAAVVAAAKASVAATIRAAAGAAAAAAATGAGCTLADAAACVSAPANLGL